MKAQQLKNAILQLAIQGKLVPQDPNDEPASVLLKKIKQEKEKLIAEGKIKKSKKSTDTPPYLNESELPFQIPESWVWVRLGAIIELISGQDLKPEQYTKEKSGIPYITGASNIIDSNLNINRYTEYPSKIAIKNDLLITCKGTIGEMLFLNEEKVHIARQIMAIRSNPKIEKYYLYYYLSTYINKLKTQAKSMIPGISRDDILSLIVAIPPLQEQKRIVAKIEELLPFIEQYAKKEQELTALHQAFPEQLKKSILQAAIQGKLTEQNPNDESAVELVKRIQAEKERLILEKKIKKPKQRSEIIVRDNSHYEIVDGVERCIDDEIPFEIPDSWCWVRLHQLGILSSGNTPKSEYLAHIGNIPYFKVSDMNTDGNEKYLIYTNHFLNKNYSGKLFSEDSIVFPKNGGAVFTNKKRILKFKSLVDLNTGVFTPSKINCFNYIFIMFNTLDFKKYYKGTALPTVDLNLIGNLLFPVPPLSEQKRIVAKIEQLFLSLENLG